MGAFLSVEWKHGEKYLTSTSNTSCKRHWQFLLQLATILSSVEGTTILRPEFFNTYRTYSNAE